MKNIILLFLFLIPAFLFAQYPTGTNKSRLGWQTTGDGLIWRGVAADTVNKPNNRNYPYFQLDTVNAVLYRYIQTKGKWQAVSPDLSPYLPIADTAAMLLPYPNIAGYGIIKSSKTIRADTTSPNGLATRLFARGLSTSIASGYLATSNGTNLVARNLFDNNTYVGILNSKPFQLGQWTTAGRPAGVNGYKGLNTTTGFEEGYFTSQWENYITSTGAANGQVSVFSSAGKTYGTNNLFWDNLNNRIAIGNTSLVRNINIKDISPSIHFVQTSSGQEYDFGVHNTNTGAFELRRTEGTNKNSWFSVMPNGTGVLSEGKRIASQIGIFATDNSTSFANSDFLEIESWNGNGYGIFSTKTGSGTIRPITIDATGVSRGSLKQIYLATSGRVGLNTTSPNYITEIGGTDAFGLPRGTVAQRPTIVASTTPLRFNTDSTALEYGESVGTWRQLATRAYARSLVSALPTTNIYTANGTLTSNRTLTGGAFNLTLAAKTTISDTTTITKGVIKTSNSPLVGKNVNTLETGSVMFGENLRKDSTGYSAGVNILFGKDLMQKASPSGGRFTLVGDNILNGVTTAFNAVGIGIFVADQSTTAGSDFFIGGSVVARYATNLNRSVILASRSFNRTTGVDLERTVAFGYGHGSTSMQRSFAGTHYGYEQIPMLVSGDQISTYGYQAGRVIKRGTNLSFIGNYTGATDTMFSDASAIGNYAAIGQNQSITLGAINGVNSATYDAKIGIGTVTPSEKLHIVGNVRFGSYGTGNKEASDLSKTQSNYVAGFATDGTVLEVTGLQVQSDQQVIFNEYDNAAPFTPSATSQTPTEFFLSPSTTGKILQRKIRQVTSVTDADFSSALVVTGLQEAQDYHIWATCSISASDSVVIDLPTPSSTYQGQMIYVYGNGQNPNPNRDVYVRSTTTQLWYGNASPQAEKYYQVTSLGLAKNSKTAVFICAYDGSNYYWQLIQTP